MAILSAGLCSAAGFDNRLAMPEMHPCLVAVRSRVRAVCAGRRFGRIAKMIRPNTPYAEYGPLILLAMWQTAIETAEFLTVLALAGMAVGLGME